MAQKIRIKRRQANGGAGAPTTLASAELAFNEASQILYYGLGDTGTGEANSVIAIGGQGAFIPSSGGTGYVKSIAVTDGTGLSKSEDNGNVTLAGIDATTTVKGVVRLATQEEINNAQLYADNVRKYMAKYAGIGLCNLTYKEIKEMYTKKEI